MTWDRESLRALRAAVAQGDPAALRAAVHGRDLDPVLQLAGEGLLATPDASLARECAARLRRRGLAGDAELADALERRPTELRAMAVDVEELASITEGDPVHGGGRIDLRTGEIWRHSPYDDPEDADALDDGDRWLWVSADSHDGWRDMAEFAGTVADAALAGTLDALAWLCRASGLEHGRRELTGDKHRLRCPSATVFGAVPR